MDPSPRLSVPAFSRPRSASRSSLHSDVDDSQDHDNATARHSLIHKQTPVPKLHTQPHRPTEQLHGSSPNPIEWLETTWFLEICFLLCSAVCAVLIIVFLSVYHNTPFDNWHFYFSINTVVSTLGVVFKSTLLMAVSAAIAQGKWVWFRKRSGSLETFEAIDAGSRETLASFKLLWHMRGQYLISAGAIVMALGFLVEPFLQAVISDYGRLVDIDMHTLHKADATIGKSSQLDGGTQCVYTWSDQYPRVDTTPDFAITAAFYDAFNIAVDQDSRTVAFTCISGNCTWKEYMSLAVRSTCFDISSLLEKTYVQNSPSDSSSSTISTTLASAATSSVSSDPALSSQPAPSYGIPISSSSPTDVQRRELVDRQQPSAAQLQSTWTDWTLEHLNMTLSNTNGALRAAKTFSVLQAAVVADPYSTINFKSSQALLAAFTVIRADNQSHIGTPSWDVAKPSAMECGLELALNIYNSSVVNNKLIDNVSASTSKKVPGSWLPKPGYTQPYNLENDTGTKDYNPIYHPTFSYRDDYQLDPSALQRNISGSFNVTQRTLLSTIDFLTTLIQKDNDDNATVKAVGDSPTLFVYGSAILQPLYNSTDTNATFKAVANSMSNAIRSLGSEPQSGTTQQWVRYYRVRWAFLALPLSLITIGTTFFFLSVWEAHKHQLPSWKANSIATMIHGPDTTLQAHLRTINHAHSLSTASETVVRLEWLDKGYALVPAQQAGVKTSRPTTPSRDEEEFEMGNVGSAATTVQNRPNSIATPAEPQAVVVGRGRDSIGSVSPAMTRPEWSHVPVDGSPDRMDRA